MEEWKQSPARGCGRRRRERGREEGREGALRERRRRSLGGPGSPGEEGRRRRGREGGRRGALGPGRGGMRAVCGAPRARGAMWRFPSGALGAGAAREALAVAFGGAAETPCPAGAVRAPAAAPRAVGTRCGTPGPAGPALSQGLAGEGGTAGAGRAAGRDAAPAAAVGRVGRGTSPADSTPPVKLKLGVSCVSRHSQIMCLQVP